MKFSTSIVNLVSILAIANPANAKSVYTYRSSGLGGNAYVGGGLCGDWPFENYVSVQASQDAFKVKGNGGQSPSAPYMDSYYSFWTDCSAESATLIEPAWDSWPSTTPTLSFSGGNRLESGSATGEFPAIKVPCTRESYEDDYYSYSCDYDQLVPVTVTVSMDWVGTGSSYPNRSTSTQRYEGGFYKYTTKGTSRDATVTLAVDIDGQPLDLEDIFDDEYSYEYGSLTKSTNSEISKYSFY
jgi:hypothetical protein